MNQKRRATIDTLVTLAIIGGFALYYIPTNQGGQVGWERVIPFGLFGLYWATREFLFRWLDKL